MNTTTIITLLVGLFGGGGIVAVINIFVNKGQRKATLFETIQKISNTQIEASAKEVERLQAVVDDVKKERAEIFSLYKECLLIKETLVDQLRELEKEVQKLRNELIKHGLFQQPEK